MILGSHWLHRDRDLHQRVSFSVELLYLNDWHPGFSLAAVSARVRMVRAKGAKVALRVDWAPGQALPPEGDLDAVQGYVEACQRIAADEVLRNCDWLICGNEPNLVIENQQMGKPMSASWPARVVFGHGMDTPDTSNVYQFVRTVNPTMQVLLPAVAPYSPEMAGGTPMPTELPGYQYGPDRPGWAPWESYQYDLMACAYNNNWHADLGEIKTAIHTYGCPWIKDIGANEPNTDQREQTYGAQFGTRWLQDCIGLLQDAQELVYDSRWAPWSLVTECNVYRPPQTPERDYPDGWWREAVKYVNSQPNVMGVACFADQDYGGDWASTAMTVPIGRNGLWNADHDFMLSHGW